MSIIATAPTRSRSKLDESGLNTALANELEQIIAESGLTRTQAAQSLGWSERSLRRALRGEHRWTLATVADVASAFNRPGSDLWLSLVRAGNDAHNEAP